MRKGGLFALALLLAPTPVAANETPRLVVLVAIDQMRRDRLDGSLPGGLGRLVRDGRSYSESRLDHAGTATCPGHASMVTGQQPGSSGVPGNQHLDRSLTVPLYCVSDTAPDAAVLGTPAGGPGRSPRKLRASALGDWLKAAHPRARVFSIAGKDRAAIALGGRRADASYWMPSLGFIGFTTSAFYRKELPEWVRAWNGEDPFVDGFLRELPETWEHRFRLDGPRPDDYAAESDRFGRTSPHTLRAETPEDTWQAYIISPWADTHTLQFARELVRKEGLGSDDVPDLLTISLSATDRIGHLYGPESHESYDALRRLDADLGEFLDFLDTQVGPGRTLIALSADHGVLPLPEWLEETGRSTCPIEGGRSNLVWMIYRLYFDLWREFTPLFTWPKAWVYFAGTNLNVDRGLAMQHGVEIETVAAFVEEWLEGEEAIETVWNRQEIRTDTGEFAELYRNSFDPERSGDLVVQIREGCLISPFDEGTSHGSPYLYDREVPIVLYGNGVEPGVIGGRARTIDIAPTLAKRLGIPFPAGLAGVPLD